MAHSFVLLPFVGLLTQLCSALRITTRVRNSRSICDRAVVGVACRKFAGKTLGKQSVRTEDLAESLMVSQASIAFFLKELGLAAAEVSCDDLCHRTVASLPEDHLPPASDVGCYMRGSERVCDLDLSEKALAAIDKNRYGTVLREEEGVRKAMTAAELKVMTAELQKIPDASFANLQVKVANWFRIWPSTQQASILSTGGSENQAELDLITKAYLATTLQKMRAFEIDSLVAKWFGGSNNETLTLVRNGVRHIDNVMQAPYYINHPNEEGYYGWVLSPYEQSSNGTWPIHFGGAYFSSGDATRIGTLTHEAAHFYPLGTDDHIYCQVSRCLNMAARQPNKAKTNADHFSFFIDEVVGGGMGELYP